LDDEDCETEVVIGWDPGGETFFARVWSRELFDRERTNGVPEGDAGLIFWTGVGDRDWNMPDQLIDAIQPYACRHNKRQLREELLADKRLNDGREYWPNAKGDGFEDGSGSC